MRLVVWFAMSLMLTLANAADAPSDPQAYCVNQSADFYPYTGEPCKSGYQLGADSGPSRTVIPTDRGQRSGDCGQFPMSV
jgi:hypothetical protein